MLSFTSAHYNPHSALQEKMQLSEDLSSAEARSSANFNLATRLARVIGEPSQHWLKLTVLIKIGHQTVAHYLGPVMAT